MFQGFVYNQIWEDPDVDLEALELKPHHRLITIASGGCNVLNYLAADPGEDHRGRSQSQSHRADAAEIAGADHTCRLRGIFPLLRQRQRQSQPQGFRQFFERAAGSRQRAAIGKSTCRCTAGASTCSRAISIATACSGASSAFCTPWRKLHGKRLDGILSARTPAEQRSAFERTIAPLFDYQVRALPVAHRRFRYTRLAFRRRNMTNSSPASDGNPIAVLRERVERLACDFPIARKLFRLAGLRARLRSRTPRGRAGLSAGRKITSSSARAWIAWKSITLR